jgi:hypothetical protein
VGADAKLVCDSCLAEEEKKREANGLGEVQRRKKYMKSDLTSQLDNIEKKA